MASININGKPFSISYFTETTPTTGDQCISATTKSPSLSLNLAGDLLEYNSGEKYVLDNGSYFLCTIINSRQVFAGYLENGTLISMVYADDGKNIIRKLGISKNFMAGNDDYSDFWGYADFNILTEVYGSQWCIGTSARGYNSFFDGVPVSEFPGPDSGSGGGGGNFDGTSDIIDFPSLPNITATSTKMVTMFNPTFTTLAELSQYLWKPDFVDAIAKLFQSPMEAILDLSMVNVTPNTRGTETIAVGWISTGISAPVVSNQYTKLNCGAIKVDEYWGSALDYNPYTTVEIFLPYIGLMILDTDDVMGATLELQYYIDLLTGTTVAMIKVTKNQLSSVLYTFSGNVNSHVPLSATNMAQLVSSVMNVVAQVGIGVASGGAGAITAVAAGSAMNALGGKMHVEKGGRLDTTGGMLSIKTPYLIITRPVQSLAANYNYFKGYPSNISAVLNTLSGYTEVEYVHVEGFVALDEEKQEIERLLKEGVII